MTLQSNFVSQSPPPPHRLRAEYLTDPLGIDVASPRLSWELRDNRPGARQTAYRITITTRGGKPVHDTGRIESDQSFLVPWPATPLTARQAVTWRVKVWDQDGKEGDYSAPAFLETGIGNDGFRNARWIGSDLVGGPRTASPSPLLRKTFSVPQNLAHARLYVTALGLYEARLNGVKVGRDELTPGWSDYRKTVYYQTYDVTALLRAGGENCLGAILGDGWYAGCVEWRGRQFYGDRPMLLARLEIRDSAGKQQVIASDGTWQVATGEILEADLIMGEAIDHRRAQPGWDTVSFKPAQAWVSASVFTPTVRKIVGQAHEPVRVTATIKPVARKEIHGWPASMYRFDLGQNLVGKVRVKLKGKPGATVRVRYAETLKGGPASTDLSEPLYLENLRSARATDYFTLGPSGEGVFETRFTFHGFRFAEVQPYPGTIESCELEALVLHTDYRKTGEFTCSEPLLNQLQHNIEWGWQGNSVDVPTDCPQRDERLGWTGDAQVFVRTAVYNFDTAAFWSKWQQDMTDAQRPEGGMPCTCPSTDLQNHDGGPAWADAFIICPWTIYLAYGDKSLLSRHYEPLKRWVRHLEETSRDGVRGVNDAGSWEGFGDWLSVNAETPKELIGSAFFAHANRLLGEIAEVLGNESDAVTYHRRATQLAATFRERYVSGKGKVVAQTQTAALLALHFDLLEPQQRKTVADDLVADIRRRGNKLSCGFVGSPYLPHVLSATGHLDVAYDLLMQKGWPSWLYAVTKGATTIWERWDGWTHDKGYQDAGMNSFNHYAYGAIGDWLYQVVAGLGTLEPGYRHLRIAPRPPGKKPATGDLLTHAGARLETPYGLAESAWKIEGGMLELTVRVPANASAQVVLPVTSADGVTENGSPLSETTVKRPAGVYVYRMPWKVEA
jgi:alpha-L-rhamnosidase